MIAEGLREGLRRVLDRLCCPACDGAADEAGALCERGAHLECARCGRRFPILSGVPDLRPDAEGSVAAKLDLEAREFYERVYAEQSYGREEQDEHLAPLRELLRTVPPDGLVLELGTGLGALQDVHPAYVGVDLSVEALVRRLRRPAFAADMQHLPLRSGSLDALFTVAVLEHVPRPDLAIAEIARVLRPGGVAYLAPAWNCRPWAAEGLHVRPWRDLDLRQRCLKALIPIRDSLAWRGGFAIPRRLARRAVWHLSSRPTAYRYRPLEANFEVFWDSDSDATAQLDPHETALYFQSRGWTVQNPSGALKAVFHRSAPVVVRKPDSAGDR
ncbi:MAG TPA: methyltransferase domain-containing protein [Candidatus Polarisedimenticolaceae bacterium]